MMKHILYLVLMTLCHSSICLSQSTQLHMKVRSLDYGEKEYSDVDTSYFEIFWNCGMDNGVRLKENLPDGKYLVFKNDTLHYTANYKENKKHGQLIYFFPNGNTSSTINYTDGLRNGKYLNFSLQGDTINTCSYENDNLIRATEYSETGVKEKSTEYENGIAIRAIIFDKNGGTLKVLDY